MNTSRIRYRDKRYNRDGIAKEKDAPRAIKQERVKTEAIKHAMTVLRCFRDTGKYAFSMITIEDVCLRALFLFALSHHPWFSHSDTISLNGEFEPIVHNWSALNDLADNDESKPAVAELHKALQRRDSFSADQADPLAPLADSDRLNAAMVDLRLLLDEVRSAPGLEPYFSEAREMQEKSNTILFQHLWTIFPPGELVFSLMAYMGRQQVFIVKESSDQTSNDRSGSRSWYLECWTYDWNGTTFNRVPYDLLSKTLKGADPSARCCVTL